MRLSALLLQLVCTRLLIVTLCGLGCSRSTSSPAPVVNAPPKPQVVALTLEGQAERINRGQILVRLKDTSGDGTKVVDVSTFELDKLTNKEGQPVPASVSNFNWSKKATEKASSSISDEVFELQLVIDTGFAEAIGNLEGAFRTYAGTVTPIEFPVKELQVGPVSDARLQALSITTTITESFKLELELNGTDTGQVAAVELLNGSDPIQQYIGARNSGDAQPSKTRRFWSWRSQSEVPQDVTLKVWLRSDDRKGEPSWISKPFQSPGNQVRHSSLNLAGAMKTDRVLSAEIKGPKQKLLEAKFVDATTAPKQSEPVVKLYNNRSIQLSVYSPAPTAALQINVLEDGFENMQTFRIENLAIENNR